MDSSGKSDALFGRYQALDIYRAVANMPKPEFTTGMVAKVANLPVSACSRELARLAKLGLVRPVSRKGDYERMDSSCFWSFVDALGREWES